MLKVDARPRQNERPRAPGQPLRLIVVDDDLSSAEALAAVLSDLGHTVCGIADSAAGAARLAERERPDLALTDTRLGGDGIAVARRLTIDHGLRSIYLSGNADHAMMARITETYPLGVVRKPVSHPQLKIALDLAARRLR